MTAVSNPRNPTTLADARHAYSQGNAMLAARLCRNLLAADPNTAEACHMLGVIRARQGRLTEARDLLERAVRLRPGKPTWTRNLANVCLRQNRPLEAIRHLESTYRNGPAELHGALNQARLAAVPQWHFPMLNDRRRAEAYRAALRQSVRPDSLVLDLGAGSGLLSFMAAKAGAAHVYAVESAPALAECARRNVESSSHSDRISLLEIDAAQLEIGVHLPRPPDVIVTEIFDASLLAEGALGMLRRANKQLVGDRTRIIPREAAVLAKLVESDELREEVSAPGASNQNASPLSRFSPMYLERNLHRYKHRELTPEVELARFDFTDPSTLFAGEQQCPVRVTRNGRCDVVVARFRLGLAEGVEYQSGTRANYAHWAHWIRFLEPPLPVRQGQSMHIRALYDDTFLALDTERD